MKRTNEYNVPEWINILLKTSDTNEVYNYTLDKLIVDSALIESHTFTSKEDEIETMVTMISVYSLIIYYFETKEKYTLCSEIKKHLKNVITVLFNFEGKYIDKLIIEAINIYQREEIKF